jgi:protein-S-isoprenylcysteine O-methyltransferase Ste14
MLDPTPVGGPALIALVAGGALFALSLVGTRLRAGGATAGERGSNASRVGIAVQMAGFASVGFGTVRRTLASGDALALAQAAAVALLMVGAVALFRAAARAMGTNWSLAARVRDDHQLVTAGVFARVRNPIYGAMAFFLLALAVALGHYAQLLLGVPLFALGTWLRVREEERLLRSRFGAAYDAYAGRVRRFVPGLF